MSNKCCSTKEEFSACCSFCWQLASVAIDSYASRALSLLPLNFSTAIVTPRRVSATSATLLAGGLVVTVLLLSEKASNYETLSMPHKFFSTKEELSACRSFFWLCPSVLQLIRTPCGLLNCCQCHSQPLSYRCGLFLQLLRLSCLDWRSRMLLLSEKASNHEPFSMSDKFFSTKKELSACRSFFRQCASVTIHSYASRPSSWLPMSFTTAIVKRRPLSATTQPLLAG